MKRHCNGFALVNALFLLVVMGVLAAVMATLSNVSHDTGNKSLLSAKVYYGAKAGLDWGIQRAHAAGSCAGSTGPFPITQGGLAGVSVTVECVESLHGATNSVYYIVSRATIGAVGAPDYAERRMEATVSNIP
jgi:MSHA biogenesis protein MshP